MKKKNYLVMLSAAFIMSAVSCGKNSDPGPKSPVGSAGPIVATGAADNTGTAGATTAAQVTGNAGTTAVQYSGWFRPTSYTKNIVAGDVHYDTDIVAPAITQNVLNTATVIVFAKLQGYPTSVWPVGQVTQLPLTINWAPRGSTLTDIWKAFENVGKITIDLTGDASTSAVVSHDHQFRYVIIPSVVKLGASVNLHDYNQVKAALHLRD